MAGNTKGLKAETPMNNVFDKFPDFIAGTLCWTPEDFKDGKDKYIVELTADEVHSVRRAIVFFKGTHTHCPLDSRLITRLSKNLAKLSHT